MSLPWWMGEPAPGELWALDAFCGEGGIGVGLARAGFRVLGLDNDPARLALYPHDSVLVEDAVPFILEHGHRFHLRHGSPTCTGYSRGTVALPDRLARYDRLIGVVREAFVTVGGPYMIENVAGARPELIDPVMLCGRMFGLTATDDDGTKLTLDRHRLFEVGGGVSVMVPEHVPHGWKSNRREGIQVAGAYGGARRDKIEAREVRKGGYVPKSVDVLRELLGTPWMSERGCQLSVPPAYAEFLGAQLAEAIRYDPTLAVVAR